ncbi:ATP-binding cassette domain-containing protein [Larsenimonas salina]|uniref:ATP-binding cassette domain-containing protein n=1 Tax=Larsenimonas salina TaxID=1295565 RepID=UPI002072E3EB|nr:ATP-binding cassette domain-containing protein [Larsenimonas salina]MCM5704422.1 ATP-binding cassette domain-containing protein [Larsenimonas salina]
MLALENIDHCYGDRRVLHDVSLSVARGERVALVGGSGEGKSTIARLALALERPSQGEVKLDDAPVGRRGRALKAFRRQVQGVFQDGPGAVNPGHTIGRIIEEPLVHLSRHSARARRARVEALLEVVKLPASYAAYLPHQLSGGQLQRVCLARALAIEPAYLVCDEATSGLDTVLQVELTRFLAETCDRTGMGLLFITHDLRLARRLCHRLIAIEQGRLVDDVIAGTAFTHPAARALEEAVLPLAPIKASAHKTHRAPQHADAVV